MSDQNKHTTALVLGNACEVIKAVIRNIAGNDISTSINGSKATSNVIDNIASQRMLSGVKSLIK